MLKQATLRFLKELRKNNDKAWFDEHRSAYETARDDFQNLVAAAIARHGKKDPSVADQEARKCLFRINRDIRFSKNKAPYKTNFGASISRGGKKSSFAGYYLHCEPGESFVGGGIWQPEPENMKKIRQEIDYNWEEFRGILRQRGFKNVYGDLYQGDDIRLSKIPQGYEKDNPAGEYLKLKSWIAMKPVPDKMLLSDEALPLILQAFEALRPLIHFLNRALEE